MKTCISLIILSLLTLNAFGQIDSTRIKIVNKVEKGILDMYYYEDDAKLISDSIHSLALSGKYDAPISTDDFLWALTTDLRAISGQNHFDVSRDSTYSSNKRYRSMLYKLRKKHRYRRYVRQMEKENIYFSNIKILDGNIAYVELKNFSTKAYGSTYKRRSLKSVMQKLKGTNAVIIDLQDNEGGVIQVTGQFAAYFSNDSNEYYLSSYSHEGYDTASWIIRRNTVVKTDLFMKTQQKNHYSKPIYVLISNRTFSSGNFAAFLLKTRSDAIIIGDRTAGAGLGPYGGYSVSENNIQLDVNIPGRSFLDTVNHISFDTTHVSPDIACLADSALLIAYHLALDSLNISMPNIKAIDSLLYNPLALFKDYGRVKIYSKQGVYFVKYDLSYMEKMELIDKQNQAYKTLEKTFVRFSNDYNSIYIKRNFGILEEFNLVK